MSTTSTTTTVTTTSLCWKANTVTAACTGRKKRALMGSLGLEDMEVTPSRSKEGLEQEQLENEDELQSGKTEAERQAKFLLYWRTTSLTSTTTTYTGTSTLASLECTPSNFGLQSCG